jgi:hypothetical protein
MRDAAAEKSSGKPGEGHQTDEQLYETFDHDLYHQ